MRDSKKILIEQLEANENNISKMLSILIEYFDANEDKVLTMHLDRHNHNIRTHRFTFLLELLYKTLCICEKLEATSYGTKLNLDYDFALDYYQQVEYFIDTYRKYIVQYESDNFHSESYEDGFNTAKNLYQTEFGKAWRKGYESALLKHNIKERTNDL